MSDVRRAAVAGTWYPAEPDALARAVDAHLERAADSARPTDLTSPTRPVALIAPHAGLVYSGPVAAHAYALTGDRAYSAIVLVGPSHFVAFDGVAIWPRGAWETPFGAIDIDSHLASAIAQQTRAVHEYPRAHAREHSLEMQMPFIARLMPHVPIVPMVMGFQTRETAEDLGRALAAAIAARQRRESVLLVASSDLSHYHDARVASTLDACVLEAVDAFDPDRLMTLLERRSEHACGGGPMVSVLHAARRLGASRAHVLRYADSGDVSGDKSAVVGYMAAAVW